MSQNRLLIVSLRCQKWSESDGKSIIDKVWILKLLLSLLLFIDITQKWNRFGSYTNHRPECTRKSEYYGNNSAIYWNCFSIKSPAYKLVSVICICFRFPVVYELQFDKLLNFLNIWIRNWRLWLPTWRRLDANRSKIVNFTVWIVNDS
jgi:hypothetical protein